MGQKHLQAELEAKRGLLGWVDLAVIGLMEFVIEADFNVIKDFNGDKTDLITNSGDRKEDYNLKENSTMAGG